MNKILSIEARSILLQLYKALSVLSNANGHNSKFQIRDLTFAFLEKSNNEYHGFHVRFINYFEDSQTINDNLELLYDTEFNYLKLFCGEREHPDSSLRNSFVQYNGQTFYVCPVNLWLCPIAFVLITKENKVAIEAFFSKYSALIQNTVVRYLEQRIYDSHSTRQIAEASKEDLIKSLVIDTASLVLPKKCSFNDDDIPYASKLFSRVEKKLSLSLLEEVNIEYHLGPIRENIDSRLKIWANDDLELEAQKSELENLLNTIYRKILGRKKDIDELISESNTIPSVKRKIDEIQNGVNHINEKLEETRNEIAMLEPRSFSFNEAPFQCYTKNLKQFEVIFKGVKVTGLGAQFCRLISILFSRPDYSISMYALYATSQEMKQKTFFEFKKDSSNQGLEQLITYLNEEVIEPKDLEKAREAGELRYFKDRLEQGLLVFNKLVEKYPDSKIQALLADYQKMRADYFSNSLEFVFEEQLVFDYTELGVTGEKKKARERITSQFKNAKDLLEVENKSFFNYLGRVISKEEKNGVHYYTYIPNNTLTEALRNIKWKLEPPGE